MREKEEKRRMRERVKRDLRTELQLEQNRAVVRTEQSCS